MTEEVQSFQDFSLGNIGEERDGKGSQKQEKVRLDLVLWEGSWFFQRFVETYFFAVFSL